MIAVFARFGCFFLFALVLRVMFVQNSSDVCV